MVRSIHPDPLKLMKGLFLTAAFVSSSIISFSPSIVQSAESESDVPICLKNTSTNEEVVFKEQCIQLRAVLKDIFREFNRIISSKKLSRTTSWLILPATSEIQSSPGLHKGRASGLEINMARHSNDNQFGVGFIYGDGALILEANLSLTDTLMPFANQKVPKGSIKITGEESTPAKALMRLSKVLDELKNL